MREERHGGNLWREIWREKEHMAEVQMRKKKVCFDITISEKYYFDNDGSEKG